MDAQAIERILRVDHAGETGAIRIYKGQIAIARRRFPSIVAPLEEMLLHEVAHFATFDRLLAARSIRACHALPLWVAGGWTLGIVTALLGQKAVWTCTSAVESVVNRHLDEQLDGLRAVDAEAFAAVASIKRDEEMHRDTAFVQGGATSGAYVALWHAIAGATSFAIWLSKRF